MQTILWEWINFALRWTHVIAGIAWIGSSFYFVHLDSSLKKRPGLPEGAGGEAWQVHGGGFYNMVKYLVAPERMPEDLTWFKWEAYATWLSGMALLCVLYYAGASIYMIDPLTLNLSPWAAVTISIALLAVGWLAYNALCRSPLGNDDVKLAAVGYVFLVFLAWLSTQIFSGRGAYMQMGALIGTMMVANVAMVIIPNQRKVVKALIAGETPDPRLGAEAKQRSMHNNYLTLPVLFVMIANHYPLSFASRWNWVILAIVLVVGAVIRHFYNTRHKGLPSPWWTWGVAVAGMLVVVFLSMAGPSHAERAAAAPAQPATFADVSAIVTSHCSMCHAQEPLQPGIGEPPKGIVLDTPEAVRLNAREVYLAAAATDFMPPAGVADIPPLEAEDRGAIASWFNAGAPGE